MCRNTFGNKFNFNALYDRQIQIIYQKNEFPTYLSNETDFVKPEFSQNPVKTIKRERLFEKSSLFQNLQCGSTR